MRCEFFGASSFGTSTERQTEIMIALTESKILALLSAISLSLVWLFKVTLNKVSTLLSDFSFSFFPSVFSFYLLFFCSSFSSFFSIFLMFFFLKVPSFP